VVALLEDQKVTSLSPGRSTSTNKRASTMYQKRATDLALVTELLNLKCVM